MHIAAAANLACPIDGAPLTAGAGALRCPHGHSFDLAREGYCNLLAVQHKASRDPGDSKEMVAARRLILDAGLYAGIATQVFELVHALPLAPDRASCIVDAGCGEGYYLDRLSELAAASPDPARLELAGIDISKWAIRAAAKRKAAVTWAVASNRRLPFLPGSVDVILSMFGFPVWEGFKAVQPPGGHVLLADPGPDHLIELRSIIYPSVNRSGPPPLTPAE
jgi:23S rRNA (guanine745-N1)-methyltransferase